MKVTGKKLASGLLFDQQLMTTGTLLALALMMAMGIAAPAGSNGTVVASTGGDHQPMECGIGCHPWYTFCVSKPFNYRCDDNGRFKRGQRYEGCEENCLCRCDSLAAGGDEE